MLSSLADAPSILVASILDRCFFHLLLSLGSCFVHPFSSNQRPSSQGTTRKTLSIFFSVCIFNDFINCFTDMAFDPCGHASFQDVKISTGNAWNFIGSNVTMRGTAKEASMRASEHRKMDTRFSLSESEPLCRH